MELRRGPAGRVDGGLRRGAGARQAGGRRCLRLPAGSRDPDPPGTYRSQGAWHRLQRHQVQPARLGGFRQSEPRRRLSRGVDRGRRQDAGAAGSAGGEGSLLRCADPRRMGRGHRQHPPAQLPDPRPRHVRLRRARLAGEDPRGRGADRAEFRQGQAAGQGGAEGRPGRGDGPAEAVQADAAGHAVDPARHVDPAVQQQDAAGRRAVRARGRDHQQRARQLAGRRADAGQRPRLRAPGHRSAAAQGAG
ncbi:hypothetical protein D9M69_397480 [compost metagenome]